MPLLSGMLEGEETNAVLGERREINRRHRTRRCGFERLVSTDELLGQDAGARGTGVPVWRTIT
jgi:hypothetical protein